MQLLPEKRPKPADSKKETVSFTSMRNFGVRNESGFVGVIIPDRGRLGKKKVAQEGIRRKKYLGKKRLPNGG